MKTITNKQARDLEVSYLHLNKVSDKSSNKTINALRRIKLIINKLKQDEQKSMANS